MVIIMMKKLIFLCIFLGKDFIQVEMIIRVNKNNVFLMTLILII